MELVSIAVSLYLKGTALVPFIKSSTDGSSVYVIVSIVLDPSTAVDRVVLLTSNIFSTRTTLGNSDVVYVRVVVKLKTP